MEKRGNTLFHIFFQPLFCHDMNRTLWALVLWTQSIVSVMSQVQPHFDEPVQEQAAMRTVPTDPWSLASAPIGVSEEEWYADSANFRRFNLDVELRSRAEYRNGYGTLRARGASPAFFINERARVGLDYQQKYLSLKLSAQHTGVWGDGCTDKPTQGNVDLYEAWARLQSAQGLFIQAGRMALAYDDERIFGAHDWSVSARAHDALRFGYEGAVHRVHGVASFNQTRENIINDTFYDGLMPYKSMQAVWYHYGNQQTPLKASFLFTNQTVQGGRDKDASFTASMQTVGAWVRYDYDDFYAKAEGYYQTGRDTSDNKIGSYLLAGRLGYRYAQLGSIEVGVDYYSGAKASEEKELHRFNTLYGSTHRFLGSMDYFVGSSVPSVGLWDCMAKVNVKPCRNVTAYLDYHYFLLGTKLTNLHSQLGHEIDVQLDWQITPYATLQAGYSTMMATSTMFFFKGGNNMSWQDWGWLSLRVNPRVFSYIFRR